MNRVLMAMSGGVDSSVAAALLVEQGHDVVGVTMKTFCYSDTPAHSKTCCGLDGLSDAKRVAAALGIPHYVFDVEEAFERNVIDNFVTQYAEGKTPNPCVRCNGYTKFRDLLSRGRALGCNRIASGHYVQIVLLGESAEKFGRWTRNRFGTLFEFAIALVVGQRFGQDDQVRPLLSCLFD